MSHLPGGGWWLLWYGTLWVSLAPYVAMTAALVRATPNEPMPTMESAFALSTMGSAVFLFLLSIHPTWRFRHR